MYWKITLLPELEQIVNGAFKVINKLVLRNPKIIFLCFKIIYRLCRTYNLKFFLNF